MARSPVVVRLACSLLGALVLLPACNDSSSKSTQDLETDAARFADVYCTAYLNCNCMGESALNDCKTAYKEYLTLLLSEMVASAPGLKIDQPKFDACLSGIATAFQSCPDWLDMSTVEGCVDPEKDGPSFLGGTRAEGDWCDVSIVCADGLACDTADDTCQPRVAEGHSCATLSCQTGLYCDGTDTCAQRLAVDASCTSTDACQEGLRCTTTTNVCAARHALTEDCTDGAGCVSGAYCDTTCLALKAGGESCSSDSQCMSDNCDTVCDPANFCTIGIF